jgi:hypothetical protein
MISGQARLTTEAQRHGEAANGATREFDSFASPRLCASVVKLLLPVVALWVPV